MNISLSEAAKLVGMSKNGIVKAIKNGRVSGQKNIHGQWEVDPAELTRVYNPIETVGGVSANKNKQVTLSELNENMILRCEVDLLRQQLDRANLEKDRVLKMLEEQIISVRQLTDQRQEKSEKSGRLWQRLFG